MADDKGRPAPAGGAEGEEEKPKSNLPVILGIMLGVIAIQATIAFFIVPKPQDPNEIAERIRADSIRRAERELTSMGAVTEFEIESIINISGTNAEHFLKAAFQIEWDDRTYRRLGPELERRIPQFRDAFIRHMSGMTLEEVTEPSAKDRIDKEMQNAINKLLPPELGEIRRIHFTTYIIQ